MPDLNQNGNVRSGNVFPGDQDRIDIADFEIGKKISISRKDHAEVSEDTAFFEDLGSIEIEPVVEIGAS